MYFAYRQVCIVFSMSSRLISLFPCVEFPYIRVFVSIHLVDRSFFFFFPGLNHQSDRQQLPIASPFPRQGKRQRTFPSCSRCCLQPRRGRKTHHLRIVYSHLQLLFLNDHRGYRQPDIQRNQLGSPRQPLQSLVKDWSMEVSIGKVIEVNGGFTVSLVVIQVMIHTV